MELVEVSKNEVLCDSSQVAKKFGMKHNRVTQTIKNILPHIDDFKGSGTVPLIKEIEREYRGKKYTGYLLNKDAFIVVMMRFETKRSRQWQGRYISAFKAMEARLLAADSNAADPAFLKTRSQGKITRKEETDIIKDFVEYATRQGSESAKFYYKHITNSCYRALGLIVQSKPKLRDTMDILELAELQLMEYRAGVLLRKYMDLGRHYKDIYESVKNELLSFGCTLRI